MGISQGLMGPVQREDGTFVFNSPIGDGHIPMIALADLGFFARYAFDHHAQTSSKNLEIASDWVGWEHPRRHIHKGDRTEGPVQP